MNAFWRLGAGTLLALSIAVSAQAAPLGVVQTFPDITLSGSHLTYDANGVDAYTGLLTVRSTAASLYEGAAAGGSSDTQSYLGDLDGIAGGATDTTRDLMLSFHVRNGLGGYTAGRFVAGNVSIGYGLPYNVPSVVQPQYSWQGTVTDFGYSDAGASAWKYFDATWNVTGDSYTNMPATLSQFSDGYLTGGMGGVKINLGSAVGGGFGTDFNVTSGVLVDVFASPIPEPGTTAMLLAGMTIVLPLVRRRKAR